MVTEKELNKFKVAELKQMIQENGVTPRGLKADLVKQLLEILTAREQAAHQQSTVNQQLVYQHSLAAGLEVQNQIAAILPSPTYASDYQQQQLYQQQQAQAQAQQQALEQQQQAQQQYLMQQQQQQALLAQQQQQEQQAREALLLQQQQAILEQQRQQEEAILEQQRQQQEQLAILEQQRQQAQQAFLEQQRQQEVLEQQRQQREALELQRQQQEALERQQQEALERQQQEALEQQRQQLAHQALLEHQQQMQQALLEQQMLAQQQQQQEAEEEYSQQGSEEMDENSNSAFVDEYQQQQQQQEQQLMASGQVYADQVYDNSESNSFQQQEEDEQSPEMLPEEQLEHQAPEEEAEDEAEDEEQLEEDDTTNNDTSQDVPSVASGESNDGVPLVAEDSQDCVAVDFSSQQQVLAEEEAAPFDQEEFGRNVPIVEEQEDEEEEENDESAGEEEAQFTTETVAFEEESVDGIVQEEEKEKEEVVTTNGYQIEEQLPVDEILPEVAVVPEVSVVKAESKVVVSSTASTPAAAPSAPVAVIKVPDDEEDEDDDLGDLSLPMLSEEEQAKMSKNQRRKYKKKMRNRVKRLERNRIEVKKAKLTSIENRRQAEEEARKKKAEVKVEVVEDEDDAMDIDDEDEAEEEKEKKRRLMEEEAKRVAALKKEEEDNQLPEKVEIEYVPEELPKDSVYMSFLKVFDKFSAVSADDASRLEAERLADANKNVDSRARILEMKKPVEMELRDDEETAADAANKLSKRKMKALTRMNISSLKQNVNHPELVEMHDITARDPVLLLILKSTRNTVPVPRHWCYKRKYLQGKRGFEKPPFKLPEFIRRTGIQEMREALAEKEDSKNLKSKLREKIRPKMGKIDIDYQKLHDAFFKWQTKPIMSIHGDLYYEGKEFETRLKDKKPGDLTSELRASLGMPTGPNANKCPPPWLIAMQRYGPPPSYPNMKIPGLNAPIPEGCSFGYHAGGWGKPPVDEYGRALYGDVFGITAAAGELALVEEEVDRSKWGELESEEESDGEEEEEEGDEDGDEEGVDKSGLVTPAAEGLVTPSGFNSVAQGIETPDMIELRKRKAAIEADMESGENPALFTVVPEKKMDRFGKDTMGSMHVYDFASLSKTTSKSSSSSRRDDGIHVALDPSELESGPLDSSAMAAKYEQSLRAQTGGGNPHEDLSDMVAEHVSKGHKRKKTEHSDPKANAAASRDKKKYQQFKF